MLLNQSKDFNILLVEDNDLDVAMLKRGLKKLGIAGSIVRAGDGLQALDILTEDLDKSVLPHPFAILLDINMPRMNGHEFLSALRADERLKDAWVTVFTTSDNDKDVSLAYQNHANGYIVKPNSAAELHRVLKSLKNYWDTCEHQVSAAV
ncbi:Response regulator receiver protein [Sulfitobacter noctilucicola]|uniref:CheY-like chemotaxis protein n=1 Tax=Sulfitobacter noctilucicola TaxID=1342301 RepID=A0A7W6Q2L6_9RHOB|nr:response regulator [Sulfitobacter noctilucicola]KIN65951.1 Response regulator receiver protein [Sulfitobacter noctilucicola]MBB4173210.1 CheY-like chemotaxis protein [Sulfitobacter noctilucicola]